MELLVRDIRLEADDVLSVGLVDPTGADLPEWTPGAHVDLALTGGVERQYSLCSDPADRSCWRVAVLRERGGRGGSRFVHERLRPGDVVTARGPVNTFALVPAREYVLVAGGIGITPILPMVRALTRAGARWRLAYLGRRAAGMAFTADPLLAGAELFVSEQDRRADLAAWIGEVAEGTAVYACGPRPMLDELESLRAGWPKGTLHMERFQPLAVPADRVDGSFVVECGRSGRTLVVEPGRSILACAEEAGLPVVSSCREGVCGTCETRVLDGVVEHRDSILSPDEREAGETLMICVSRATSPQLVLDI